MTPPSIRLAAVGFLLAGIIPGHAALIAYEGFETPGTYTDGSPIVGISGGSGWTGAFTQGGALSFHGNSAGLTFGDLQTTVGQATVPLDGGNPFNFVQNGRTFSPIGSGSLWMSWLYAPGSPDSIYSGLGLSQTGGGELFYIGTDGNGQLRIDTSGAGGTNASYGALTASTQFITVHVDYSTGNVDVYRNPAPGGALGSAVASFSGISPGAVGSIVFLGGANGTTSFDEIRLGTSYQDVSPIPEPAACLMLLAAGVMPLARRRRSASAGR